MPPKPDAAVAGPSPVGEIWNAHAFSGYAGALIFVVVKELIPEPQSSGNGDVATLGVMLGFAVMMFLDVALG